MLSIPKRARCFLFSCLLLRLIKIKSSAYTAIWTAFRMSKTRFLFSYHCENQISHKFFRSRSNDYDVSLRIVHNLLLESFESFESVELFDSNDGRSKLVDHQTNSKEQSIGICPISDWWEKVWAFFVHQTLFTTLLNRIHLVFTPPQANYKFHRCMLFMHEQSDQN